MLKLPGKTLSTPSNALTPWRKPRKDLRLSSTGVFFMSLLLMYVAVDSIPKSSLKVNELWWTNKYYYQRRYFDVLRRCNV
jgi:hypothetical protein